MADIDLSAQIQSYLEAFTQRDVARCMEFFGEDSTVHFAMGVYSGTSSIMEWHRARFDADLKVVQLESMAVDADQVVVEALVASKRLRALRINSIRVKGTFDFIDHRIREANFTLAGAGFLENWH